MALKSFFLIIVVTLGINTSLLNEKVDLINLLWQIRSIKVYVIFLFLAVPSENSRWCKLVSCGTELDVLFKWI